MSWPSVRSYSTSPKMPLISPPSRPGDAVPKLTASRSGGKSKQRPPVKNAQPTALEGEQHPLPSRPCEVCKSSNITTYYCILCDGSFCDGPDGCWDKERPHSLGKRGPDGLPHEKSDSRIVNRLKETFNPTNDPKIQERMHMEDEDTTWFGIARNAANLPMFQDYGRYATLMANSATGDCIRYPQLVSFIGQTGAGKSTLVKLLIEQQHALTSTPRSILFSTPIVGSKHNDNLPTSGDVHLYADPATYLTGTPMLYADCEGLDGGENLPIGVRHRDMGDRKYTKESFAESSRLSKKRWVIARGGQRDITWATSPETQKRQYAVTELYPRLLYTFSDVIVFVLKEPKTFESVVLSKLLWWASSSMEKSLNQPTLPHAIIALNATDLGVNEREWDSDFSTERLLSTVAGSITRDVKYKEYADFWIGRVRVVRIPTKGRYMLIDDQVRKLHHEITQSCNISYFAKRRARMLSNSDELHVYLQSAFDHFSLNLDKPFNFIEVAFKNNPIPLDFGGNILKLAVAIKDRSRRQFETGPKIFRELATMVASSIMLDCVRNNLRGSAEVLLEKYYMEYCDYALQDFCDLFWPCEYHSKRGRCVNVQEGHTKGHQTDKGTVIGMGTFQAEFTWDSFEAEWQKLVENQVRQMETQIRDRLQDRNINETKLTSNMHKHTMQAFYNRLGGAELFYNHSTCFCCLRESPEHPLPCGHVLCTPCVKDYGIRLLGTVYQMNCCPLHPNQSFSPPWQIKYKPDMAGVRILCLDGGGIRGIVELEVLAELERHLGGKIPIQSFFDLIVGTSTGGIIALGLGVQYWSVQECINKFTRLVDKAFTPRINGFFGAFGTKYRTKPIEDALQDAFGRELLFGGCHDESSSYFAKVAVTATSETGDQAVLLTNYNRQEDQQGLYKFVRPDSPLHELKIWEVARAASAAPTFFKPFVNSRTKEGYVDGALYNNNPAQIAYQESKLVFPNIEHFQPDIFLSLGTGHNGQETTGFAETRNILSRRFSVDHHRHQIPESPGEHRRRFSWLRSVPFLANISVMANRIDNALSSEQQWHEFRTHVLGSHATESRRYIRLNPKLNYGPPRLDEKSELGRLQQVVRKNLSRPGYQSRISQTVHRLVASCFYLERQKLPIEGEQNNAVIGRIKCRFADGSSDLRDLGTFLSGHQTATFQPFFRIHEKHHEHAAVRKIITHEIVLSMRRLATFRMADIEINVSKRNGPTTISLGLRDQHTSRGEDIVPISGFPRVLLLDHVERVPSAESPNLGKSKTVKRRQTRHRKSSSTVSSSSNLDEISKMKAIAEKPQKAGMQYPENPDDVNDWVQRRANRRPRFKPYMTPAAESSSSPSSRAASPSSILHSEIFELPASNISATLRSAAAQESEDEDDAELRAAIAMSLQATEMIGRNNSSNHPFSMSQEDLNEALERSKLEQ